MLIQIVICFYVKMFVYFYTQALIDYRINEKILNYIFEINNTDAEFGVEECEVFLTFLYVILVMSMVTGYVCFFIGSTCNSSGIIFEYVKFVIFIIIYLSWDVFHYDAVTEFIILIFFKAFSIIELSVNEKTGTTTDSIDDYIFFKLGKHFYFLCFHICLLFFNNRTLETCILVLWIAKYFYIIISYIQKRIVTSKRHILNKKNMTSSEMVPKPRHFNPQIPPSSLETPSTTGIHAPRHKQSLNRVNSVTFNPKSQAPFVLFVSQQTLPSQSLAIKLNNNRKNAIQDGMVEDLSPLEHGPDLLELSRGNDVNYSSSMAACSKYLYNRDVLSIVNPVHHRMEVPQLMENSIAKWDVQLEDNYTPQCTIHRSASDQSTMHGNSEASSDVVFGEDFSFSGNLTKDSYSVNDSCNGCEGVDGDDDGGGEDDASVYSHFNLRPLTLILPSYMTTVMADVPNNNNNNNNAIIHADNFNTSQCHIEQHSMFYNRIFLCLLGIIFIIFNTYEILFEIKMYAIFFRTIVFSKSLYCQNFILFHLICTFEIGLIYYVRHNISFDMLTSRYNSLFSMIICVCCLSHLVMLKFSFAIYSWVYLFITSQLVVAPVLVLNQIYNNSFYFQCKPKDKIIMKLIRDAGSTVCIIVSILIKLFILNNLYVFDILYYYDYIFIIMLVITLFYQKILL